MKILIDARVAGDHFTGIGRYAFGLVKHLPAAFPGIEFVALRNPEVPNRRFDWGRLASIPNLRVLPCSGSGLGLMDVLALRSAVLREAPDLVQAPHFTGAFGHGVPAVVTLHDFIPFDFPSSGPRGFLARAGLRHTARVARSVVTPTEAGRQEAIARFGLRRERVRAIAHGIECPPEGRLPEALSPGVPYVLYVGAQKPHKNLPGLLGAHALAFGGGEMRLVLAGPFSKWTAGLRAQAAALGLGSRVIFTGVVDDPTLGALLRGARALAQVSFCEGFGIPMLEAMSVSLPVVASDRPVFREVCGDAALFAPPEHPPAIALALAEATAGGTAVELRVAEGLRRAAAQCWGAVAPRYAACYGLDSAA